MSRFTVKEMGLIDYKEAWEIQKTLFNELIEKKMKGESGAMHLLLLEHPHVYTMGLHGNTGNMLFSDEMLEKIGAKYYKIERGGDITYHGYGQLVGYPIIDLEELGIGIKQYIWALEEAIIKTVADYGVSASRMEGAVGVWLDCGKPSARKIAAIGVKASRYVTMHGFALNVTTNLDYFNYINPCGFVDKGVTSIAKETGLTPTLKEVGEKFTKHLEEILG